MTAWDKVRKALAKRPKTDDRGRDVSPPSQLEKVKRILRDDAARDAEERDR